MTLDDLDIWTEECCHRAGPDFERMVFEWRGSDILHPNGWTPWTPLMGPQEVPSHRFYQVRAWLDGGLVDMSEVAESMRLQ